MVSAFTAIFTVVFPPIPAVLRNFNDTANVQIFKWQSFKKSSEDKLNVIFYALIDKLLIKLIIINQKFYRGGKVKIDLLKDPLNIKPTEIRNRVKNLIASGTIDAEFNTDKDEVIIFTKERKELIGEPVEIRPANYVSHCDRAGVVC